MQELSNVALADELLAVCDAGGRPLRSGQPRGAVHREGWWHRSFHCWVVRAGRRGPELVLQRRARTKDTHPEYQDVYLLRCDQPLSAYTPDSGEVDGVAAFPPATLVAVARGMVRHARSRGRLFEGEGWRDEAVLLTRATLVPRAGRYYERVARAAMRLAHRPPPILA
jgi:hypothetical protein